MKDRALILDPVKSIIDLTSKLESKKKFAYVNISRSAVNALTHSSEKKAPKKFLKDLEKCVQINDENFLKAIPIEFSKDIESGNLSSVGLKNDLTYYDAAMFEYFYFNKKEVVDIFVNHYIKDTKNVILSFHDKKVVQKMFGLNNYFVFVPYNNFYDKVDSICAQISEFNGGVDNLILDCPLLATAIAPKVWESLEMSIIDFGKVISSIRFQAYNSEKNTESNRNRVKNFKKRK
jgi:hypothetical protein